MRRPTENPGRQYFRRDCAEEKVFPRGACTHCCLAARRRALTVPPWPAQVNSRLSIGLGYDTQLENPFGEIKLRKRFELSEDGLCCLDFKAKYRYIRSKQFQVRPGGAPGPIRPVVRHKTRCVHRARVQSEQEAKAQVSTKIFNFTEDQDLRLKFGYDVLNKVRRATLPARQRARAFS